jgi:sporulation protein YlmC with PRC-barrel domain
MDAVGDLLDQPVVDRDGREMGRVDGIELDCVPGEPPRLAALLIGPSALAHRLHPALGRMAAAIERRLGLRGGPARIPVDAIDRIQGKVMLRISIRDTDVGAVEQRLRAWVVKLPGSR